MKRIPFVLKAREERDADKILALKADFFKACEEGEIENFSLWTVDKYIFGYGESLREDSTAFDTVFEKLPEGLELICSPGSMRLMYHCIGIIREDKTLIRHRVFVTRLKPGCEEEYKRRHDRLIEARGDTVPEGPESNFTIWYGDGHIFGYCELVRSYDTHIPTEDETAATVAWETRGLEIMDWLTDDVDWITGEKHPHIRQLL